MSLETCARFSFRFCYTDPFAHARLSLHACQTAQLIIILKPCGSMKSFPLGYVANRLQRRVRCYVDSSVGKPIMKNNDSVLNRPDTTSKSGRLKASTETLQWISISNLKGTLSPFDMHPWHTTTTKDVFAICLLFIMFFV